MRNAAATRWTSQADEKKQRSARTGHGSRRRCKSTTTRSRQRWDDGRQGKGNLSGEGKLQRASVPRRIGLSAPRAVAIILDGTAMGGKERGCRARRHRKARRRRESAGATAKPGLECRTIMLSRRAGAGPRRDHDLMGLCALHARESGRSKGRHRLRLLGDHGAFSPDTARMAKKRWRKPPATSDDTPIALNYGSREWQPAAQRLAGRVRRGARAKRRRAAIEMRRYGRAPAITSHTHRASIDCPFSLWQDVCGNCCCDTPCGTTSRRCAAGALEDFAARSASVPMTELRKGSLGSQHPLRGRGDEMQSPASQLCRRMAVTGDGRPRRRLRMVEGATAPRPRAWTGRAATSWRAHAALPSG